MSSENSISLKLWRKKRSPNSQSFTKLVPHTYTSNMLFRFKGFIKIPPTVITVFELYLVIHFEEHLRTEDFMIKTGGSKKSADPVRRPISSQSQERWSKLGELLADMKGGETVAGRVWAASAGCGPPGPIKEPLVNSRIAAYCWGVKALTN